MKYPGKPSSASIIISNHTVAVSKINISKKVMIHAYSVHTIDSIHTHTKALIVSFKEVLDNCSKLESSGVNE